MATPISSNVGETLKAMWDAMIDSILIWIGFIVCFADTLCNDFGVAFLMAGVLAIRTLHPGGILQEFTTKCTAHDIVELLLDKFMTLLLVDLFLLLSNSPLAIQPNVEWSTSTHLFLEAHGQMYSSGRL